MKIKNDIKIYLLSLLSCLYLCVSVFSNNFHHHHQGGVSVDISTLKFDKAYSQSQYSDIQDCWVCHFNSVNHYDTAELFYFEALQQDDFTQIVVESICFIKESFQEVPSLRGPPTFFM